MDLKKVYFAKLQRKLFFFFFSIYRSHDVRGRRLCVYQNMMQPATTRGPTAAHNSSQVE